MTLSDSVTLINPYSAGIDFSRQNLTTKVYPRTVIVKTISNGCLPTRSVFK